MGYADRDPPAARAADRSRAPDLVAAIGAVSSVFVRLAGVVLVLVGLSVAIQVVFEAWGLYRHPDHIERLAERINTVAGSGASPALNRNPSHSADPAAPEAGTLGKAQDGLDYRLSYLLAWLLGIALLLVIGRLSFWAIDVGGRLATHTSAGSRRLHGRDAD